MRHDDHHDKRCFILILILLILAILAGIIWWHYDKELDAIERHKNELKTTFK